MSDGDAAALLDAATPDGQVMVGRRQVMVFSSDDRGLARVGTLGSGADLVLLDATTQKPVRGARIDAVEEAEGFFLRISDANATFEPEVLQVTRGGRMVVALNTSTPDVRGRVVRLGTKVQDEDFLGEGDINHVMVLAADEQRPSVVFAPEIAPGTPITAERFFVYRSPLPGTLMALRAAGVRPVGGAVVQTASRVVATQGLRRAGVPVQGAQVHGAAMARRGAVVVAPVVFNLQVTAPDAAGVATLVWSASDQGNLLGFDVGVDTSAPARRIDKSARAWVMKVARGAHYACVRPVFDGSDVEPRMDCVPFDAPLAPAAPELRMVLQPLAGSPMAARARQPVAVQVEVVNDGDLPTDGFDVTIGLSRDGRANSIEGETRIVHFDGVPARGKSLRVATVVPGRDGHQYISALADPQGGLAEGNPFDNGAHLPVKVEPTGNNRAPILSLNTSAQQGSVVRGRSLALSATAVDPEEGDLTSRIVWTSERDGFLGQGGSVETSALSPGRHRIVATVKDGGVVMAPAPFDNEKLFGKGYGFGLLWPLSQTPIVAAQLELPEQVVAQFVVEVVDPATPPNSEPVIAAGPQLTTSVGVGISPIASAFDPDGDPITVSWQAFFGAASLPLQNANTLSPTLVPTVAGPHRLVMEVSDGKVVARAETVILVLANNQPPVVQVELPAIGVVGASAQATVIASDPDNDSLTLSYQLVRPVGSQSWLQAGSSLMPSFVPDLPGLYELAAFADDGRGGRTRFSARLTVDANVMPDAGAMPIDAAAMPADAGITMPVDAGITTPDAAVQMDAPTQEPDATAPPDAPRMTSPLGSPCAQGWECGSGQCTDGVCCESACVGLCETCMEPGFVGQCKPAIEGTNPRNECPEGSSCTAIGQCGPFLVRADAINVGAGQVWLPGYGTYRRADLHQSLQATCDETSRLCLVAVANPNMSGSFELRAISIEAPLTAPQIVEKEIFSLGADIGFEHGVVRGRNSFGWPFAWKPGWILPQVLIADPMAGECVISPSGTHVACTSNLRTDVQGGSLLDVHMGPLVAGAEPLPLIASVHVPVAEERWPRPVFSGDGKFMILAGEPAAGSSAAIRLFPTSGGNPQVLVQEAGLGEHVQASPDGKWVAFLRFVSTTNFNEQGTLAIASLEGTPNVRNLASDVNGFAFLTAASDLGFISLPAGATTGRLQRVANPAEGTAVIIQDRVFPGDVAVSPNGIHVAVLRETNGNGIFELWAGRFDGTGWRLLDERENIAVGGEGRFSAAGDTLLWQWRNSTDPEAPETTLATRIPLVGPTYTTVLGDNVTNADFTKDGRVIFVSASRQGTYSPFVLRLWDGVQSPGQMLQSEVGEGLGYLNGQVLFTVQQTGSAAGAYVLKL